MPKGRPEMNIDAKINEVSPGGKNSWTGNVWLTGKIYAGPSTVIGRTVTLRIDKSQIDEIISLLKMEVK